LPHFIIVAGLVLLSTVSLTAHSSSLAKSPSTKTDTRKNTLESVQRLSIHSNPIFSSLEENVLKVVSQQPPNKFIVQTQPIPAVVDPEDSDILSKPSIPAVPFYSQFTDISYDSWQKVGCGIASLAMLIDYYKSSVSVDSLLLAGIEKDAYIDEAGWSHQGLIELAQPYGLKGATHGLSHLSMDEAFSELQTALSEGPVMVSVHYTFEPTNPIPHLVVITGINSNRVYYNDPAESTGGNSLSVSKFQKAWKKRYIEIRPTT
jgi:predicted double-glycine peptidase